MLGWMKQAYATAALSEDESTQNGAVLVSAAGELIGRGYNRIFPVTCDTPDRRKRPEKYTWTIHAEQDAVFDAVWDGREVPGSTLYCAWAACAKCAHTLIGCGVTKVVRHSIPQHADRPDWFESIRAGDEMFEAMGVEVVTLTEPIGACIRFNGAMVDV